MAQPGRRVGRAEQRGEPRSAFRAPPWFGTQAKMGKGNGSLEHSEHLIRPQLGPPDRGSVGNEARRKEGMQESN